MDADRSFVPKTRRSACSACSLQFFGNKKNHMPDARGACRAYDWGFGSIFPPLPQTSLLDGGLGVSPVKAYGLAVDCI